MLLTDYAIDLADRRLAMHGVKLGSPRDPERRGGHVALRHPNARALTKRLETDHNVIVDFREPNIVRVGLSPLTTSFADVHDGLTQLTERLQTGG
jgi:kynureninase